MDFSGKTILITGAGSGIGLATAELLAYKGATQLILIDRDGDSLRRVQLACETQIGRDQAFAEMGAMATPLKRYAKPEEIAGQIAFPLSDACRTVTGTVFVSDGGDTL